MARSFLRATGTVQARTSSGEIIVVPNAATLATPGPPFVLQSARGDRGDPPRPARPRTARGRPPERSSPRLRRAPPPRRSDPPGVDRRTARTVRLLLISSRDGGSGSFATIPGCAGLLDREGQRRRGRRSARSRTSTAAPGTGSARGPPGACPRQRVGHRQRMQPAVIAAWCRCASTPACCVRGVVQVQVIRGHRPADAAPHTVTSSAHRLARRHGVQSSVCTRTSRWTRAVERPAGAVRAGVGRWCSAGSAPHRRIMVAPMSSTPESQARPATVHAGACSAASKTARWAGARTRRT